ncbi:MAG: hypothetical protein AUI83_02910 [Armatimonadetes bacterium 13_1_40CM_3_65_7]|nr:MAG: hypothetical protein AUI83_02910 [Armatimonadetes bacterium 13_1_40CM_3_65_7]
MFKPDIERPEGREIGRQTSNDHLEETFGATKILEVILSQIPQAHDLRQLVCYECSDCVGEEHLASMRGAHEPCRKVHIQADVAFRGAFRFACMQAHTHSYLQFIGPGVSSYAALGGHCC